MAKINSNTSSTTNVSAYSSHGLSGLASGIDTESMVQAMLQTAQKRIDTQNQKITKLEWKQSAYRDFITHIQSFQSKFFSFTNPSTNIKSASFWKSCTVNSSNPAISVASSSTKGEANINVSQIKQLATASKLSGKSGVSSGINLELGDVSEIFKDNKEVSFNVALDGVSKKITISNKDGSITDKNSFVDALNAELQNVFGSTVKASINAGTGNFELATYKSNGEKSNNHSLVLGASSDEAKALFNTDKGEISNKISMQTTVGELLPSLQEDTTKFTINGVEIEIGKDDTLSTLIKKVNESDANVTMTYDSIKDGFTLSANNTGAGISLTYSGDVIEKLFGQVGDEGYSFTEGQNAVLTVNGTEIERNSNTFSVDGISITLNDTYNVDGSLSGGISITSKQDTDKIVNTIKDFVSGYNEMITKINDSINESAKEARSYPPLTEAQKKEMTEKEIELWEEKAKTGLLANDDLLSSLKNNLRSVLYTKASDDGLALYDLGIVTNVDGTLKIDDEAKLKNMVETNSEKVADLFSNAEKGLSVKIDSICDKYAKQSSGSPGLLVQKAGVKNTATESQNLISKEIRNLKDLLERLQDQYDRRKERYWKQFSSLETMISNSNATSEWLSSAFTY